MATVTVTKEFRFEASHRLLNHNGKCAKPHGHSYRVVIEVVGVPFPTDGKSSEGMVMDFGLISREWAHFDGLLDHNDLNVVLGPEIGPTTAENIALWLLKELPFADAVTVYETATSSARAER